MLLVLNVLSKQYGEGIQEHLNTVPTTADWKATENGFRKEWHFPGCCGVIDGKHVIIKAPPDSGSLYYNYKDSNSIVLMVVVDHKYCFSYIDIGCNGWVSNGINALFPIPSYDNPQVKPPLS